MYQRVYSLIDMTHNVETAVSNALMPRGQSSSNKFLEVVKNNRKISVAGSPAISLFKNWLLQE